MTSPQRSLVNSPPELGQTRELKFCLMCKDRPNISEFICTDCVIPLCGECKCLHKSMQRFSSHRIQPYEEVTRCPQHSKRRLLFCQQCAVDCCLICAQFGQHRGHPVNDKASEMMVRQAAMQREAESLRKSIEDRLQKRLDLVQAYTLEVDEFEEAAIKAFEALVAEHKSKLSGMLTKVNTRAESIKTRNEFKTAEELARFKESLNELGGANWLEGVPTTFEFEFTKSFETKFPSDRFTPQSAAPKPEALPRSFPESPRARTASVPGFTDFNSQLDDDPFLSDLQSERRNPTVAPADCIYLPMNESQQVVMFDMEERKCSLVPCRRSWSRFCSLTLLRPGFAIVTGGGDIPQKHAFELNLLSMESTELANMQTARNYHSSISTQNGPLVVGGYNQLMKHDCELYSETTNQWTEIAPMNFARGALGLCGHKGCIYAFGGWDGHKEMSEIECLRTLKTPWEVMPICLPQASQCNAVSLDTFVLIFAYQAERAYAFTPDMISDYSKLSNEAWGRPELVCYKNFIFGFKSDARKVLCYDLRQRHLQCVEVIP